MVYVYPREFLTVVVVDRRQPVVMLAAAISLKVGVSLPGRHLNLGRRNPVGMLSRFARSRKPLRFGIGL